MKAGLTCSSWRSASTTPYLASACATAVVRSAPSARAPARSDSHVRRAAVDSASAAASAASFAASLADVADTQGRADHPARHLTRWPLTQ